jgi:hypothetical protein
MPTLVCPLCDEKQSPDGPGVGSWRDEDVPESEWESYWVAFIEDLRGTPGRTGALGPSRVLRGGTRAGNVGIPGD